MSDSFSIGLSGMNAAAHKVHVSANNIVNAHNETEAPTAPADYKGYEPQAVQQTPVPGGGVASQPVSVDPAYLTYLTAEGEMAAPNVTLEEEILNLQAASHAYEASASVIKTEDEMSDTLLSIV